MCDKMYPSPPPPRADHPCPCGNCRNPKNKPARKTDEHLTERGHGTGGR